MKLILIALVSFGLGIILSDFVKAQISKLERKNK
jgi:hypothetical protein